MLNKTLDEIAQTGAQLYQGYQNAVQSRWNAPGQPQAAGTPPYGYQPTPAAPGAFQAPLAPKAEQPAQPPRLMHLEHAPLDSIPAVLPLWRLFDRIARTGRT